MKTMVRLLVQRVRMKVAKSRHLKLERQHLRRHIPVDAEAAVVVVVRRVTTSVVTVAVAVVVHHQDVKQIWK